MRIRDTKIEILAEDGSCKASVDLVRQLFDAKAESWPAKYGGNGPLTPRLHQFSENLAFVCPPPTRILDFGCGSGELACHLLRMGYSVTACDISEEMLRVARELHRHANVDWIRLVPNWQTLPFEASQFDGVVASSVFEYLPNMTQVLTELARVLRPGGWLLFSAPNPRSWVRRCEAGLQFLSDLPPINRIVAISRRLREYFIYLRVSRNRLREEEWQVVLGEAGFLPCKNRDPILGGQAKARNAPLVLLIFRRSAAAPRELPSLDLGAGAKVNE